MAVEERQDTAPTEAKASGVQSREEKLAKLRSYSARFYASEHGKATKEAYKKTPKGKEVHNKSMANYRATKPAAITRYEQSEARLAAKREYGKAYRARKKAEKLARAQPQEILPPSPGPA